MSRSGWRLFQGGDWAGLGGHMHSLALAETDMLYQYHIGGVSTPHREDITGTTARHRRRVGICVVAQRTFQLHGASPDMYNVNATSVIGQAGITSRLAILKQSQVSTQQAFWARNRKRGTALAAERSRSHAGGAQAEAIWRSVVMLSGGR
jgi:hypothetical protein